MHCIFINTPSSMIKKCTKSLKTVADYKRIAKTKIAECYFNYFRRGTGEEQALRLNVTAYKE